MKDLTEKQYNVYAYILHYRDVNGVSPSRAEIAKALGYKSPNSVQEILPRIAKKGYITLVPDISRGIVISGV